MKTLSRHRYTKTKFRGLLKRHGGKTYLARRIISCAPPAFDAFCDAFAGSCVIPLNLSFVGPVMINDLDPDAINVAYVVRNHAQGLASALSQIPYTEESFNHWKGLEKDPQLCHDRLRWATQHLVVNRMSRGGLGESFAWSERQRGGRPGDENAWRTFCEDLPSIGARLSTLSPHITNMHAFEAIRWFASAHPDGWIYLDPPYLHETRAKNCREAYSFEFTDLEHSALLDMVLDLPCKVSISGYPSPLYDSKLNDWSKIQWTMPNHAGQGQTKQRRTEVMWSNFEMPNA